MMTIKQTTYFILVANPKTVTNNLSMCMTGDSGCQPDCFKGAMEFLTQVDIVLVQWVEDFGWTTGRGGGGPGIVTLCILVRSFLLPLALKPPALSLFQDSWALKWA